MNLAPFGGFPKNDGMGKFLDASHVAEVEERLMP
jgi:hypothetical protein